MLNVYIIYPVHRISVHHNPDCATIRSHHTADQRICKIAASTLSLELRRFQNGYYHFGANKETNDMWLKVDLGDEGSEMATVNQIHRLLADRYKPFTRTVVSVHC